MPGKIGVIAALLLGLAQPACSDVYRYTGDDGVECYTDAPASSDATLIIKDRKLPPRKTRERPASAASASAYKQTRLPVQGRVTSLVGLRNDPLDGDLRHHKGVDIAVPLGTPVRPVAPGTVMFSGPRQGYGNTVMIRHADDLVTLYAHHAENLVTEGATVDDSTVIALSGATGRCTGPHLHFEAWRSGQNVTSEYISGTETAQENRVAKASSWIKRYVQEDGTLVFTNLQ